MENWQSLISSDVLLPGFVHCFCWAMWHCSVLHKPYHFCDKGGVLVPVWHSSSRIIWPFASLFVTVLIAVLSKHWIMLIMYHPLSFHTTRICHWLFEHAFGILFQQGGTYHTLCIVSFFHILEDCGGKMSCGIFRDRIVELPLFLLEVRFHWEM